MFSNGFFLWSNVLFSNSLGRLVVQDFEVFAFPINSYFWRAYIKLEEKWAHNHHTVASLKSLHITLLLQPPHRGIDLDDYAQKLNDPRWRRNFYCQIKPEIFSFILLSVALLMYSRCVILMMKTKLKILFLARPAVFTLKLFKGVNKKTPMICSDYCQTQTPLKMFILY